jgi:hypothetical protein
MQEVTRSITSGSNRDVNMARWRRWWSRFAFLALSSAVVVVSSEKFYWYPSQFKIAAFAELMLFYSLPLALTFLVVDRYRVGGVRAVGIASAVFALGVEGVITPVVYEDGPLPVMAFYFLAWHGYAAFVLGWYLVRKWALERKRGLLAAVAVAQGATWGFWSITWWRAESVAELEAENAAGIGVWDPGQWPTVRFALYAMTATVVMFVAHRLLDLVWPTDWTLTRRWRRALIALTVMGVALISIAVPWAVLKLAVLGWPIVVLLRRHRDRTAGQIDQPVFVELSGRVRSIDLTPLLLNGPAAIIVYWAFAAIEPSEAFLDGVLGIFVVVQVLVAAVFVATWLRRIKPEPTAGVSDAGDGERRRVS